MITSAKRSLLSAAVALIATCMLFATPAQAAQADRCPGSLDVPASAEALSGAEAAVACLVNAERPSRGLRPLRRDSDLTQAASHHAADMVRRDFFSHVTPTGRSLHDRIGD